MAGHRCRGNRALFPPSLVADVEDEDEERQEEDVDDEDGREGVSALFSHQTIM